MLRLTRKFLRFDPDPTYLRRYWERPKKAAPMSVEPSNLAGMKGGVKEFVYPKNDKLETGRMTMVSDSDGRRLSLRPLRPFSRPSR